MGRLGLMYEEIQAQLAANHRGSLWCYLRTKTIWIAKRVFSHFSSQHSDYRKTWITGLKRLSLLFHTAMSKGPRWLVVTYVNVLSLFSRAVDKKELSVRIRARLIGPPWPVIDFRPRKVTLGTHTNVALYPHLGEFDEEALFRRRLSYERQCLRWLEERVSDNYDSIIEIGANVGLYSVFFDQLSRRPNARLKKIFAFEPATEAYRQAVF